MPSSVAGQVREIKVKAGDKVKVGHPILSVDSGDGASASAAPPAADVARPFQGRERGGKPRVQERERDRGAESPAVQDREKVVDFSRAVRSTAVEPSPGGPAAPAAPSVRRMARELGVDIADVAGSATGAGISIEDVKAHAKRLVTIAKAGPAATAASGMVPASEPLPDFGRWGAIERQPMRGVRRKTAEHLASVADLGAARHPIRRRRHHRLRGHPQASRERGG